MRFASGGSHGHSQSDGCLLVFIAHCGKSLACCPCSNLFTWPTSCANPYARLFLRKETGAHTTAAAHIERGFAANLPMTIGVTNTEVTNNSDVDDGAADHGLDCTWLTARYAPVIASLPSPDSGSRGTGFVSQRSLHPPTGFGVQEARS